MVRALGASVSRARGARDRRRLARRDRRDRGPARRRAAVGARPAPGAKGGLRPRVPGRVSARLDLGADLVLEMDCDFSTTRPTCLAWSRRRRTRISCSARATSGGGTRNWGLVRRFISRGGSLYAQVLLQLGIRDLTGGFKCYRRAVLEAIDLGRDLVARLRVPDRDDLSGASCRLPRGRGADHVLRPRGGRLEDEQGDRARGDLEGPAASPPRPRRALDGHVWVRRRTSLGTGSLWPCLT